MRFRISCFQFFYCCGFMIIIIVLASPLFLCNVFTISCLFCVIRVVSCFTLTVNFLWCFNSVLSLCLIFLHYFHLHFLPLPCVWSAIAVQCIKSPFLLFVALPVFFMLLFLLSCCLFSSLDSFSGFFGFHHFSFKSSFIICCCLYEIISD